MNSITFLVRRGLGVGVVALVLALHVPAPQAWAQARNLPDFTDLVEQVSPSVVNIRTLEKIQRNTEPEGQAQGPDEEMQDLLRRFFGIPMPGPRQQQPQRPGRPQPEDRQRGIGSGFILTSDGFIMTNAHVVQGADQVIVTLTDKREFKARIIGADRRTDVAVVKIDANGLPAVRIGDVGRLRAGQWVMAIGSPFGLDNTVTAGIVSAKQRDTGDYLPFIQTDVAINPGNSGGPLINMNGEVVGINSQIYSRSGGFMGISFAIPIDEAIRISDQLRSNGRVMRGRIGVQIDQVSKEVAESLGLSRAQGALVRAVEPGGPAEKAGVEAGDIVLKVDNALIEKANDLPRQVGNLRPGAKATLQVWRRGAARDLSVTIGEFEPEKTAARTPAPEEEKKAGSVRQWGLQVTELSEAQRRELKLKGGVRVESATEAAARAGLREGDVITAIANTEISTVAEFEAVANRMDKNRPVNVLFRRGEWAQYTLIRPAR
ncbi:MAG: DegQ family serine endoprotease [Alphaproteobacteria bacterium]|nr:DegQ family serine endoprotease [Alphaproteobacteria bacterium]